MKFVFIFQFTACFGYGSSAIGYRSQKNWLASQKVAEQLNQSNTVSPLRQIPKLRMRKDPVNPKRRPSRRLSNFYNHHRG